MAGSGRSRADFKLVAELAVGATIADAARAADVSERTAYRRLQDATFQARLGQARDHLTRRAVGLLCAGSPRAAEVLMGIADDDTAAPSVRRAAARDVLELGLIRLREVQELAARITALEEFLAPGRLRGVP